METLHQSGEIIAQRYRIVTALGKGGMGTTYAAEDITNQQKVAIKVVSLRQTTEWKVLELFEREAKVLANLDHPHIPQYLDYFHLDTPEDRRFYLVQQLVEGQSLADLVSQGWHTNETEVKKIAQQILEILDYLHCLNPPVIHRDIKPQNIIRCADGAIYLVDFGAVQDIYRNTITRGGTFVGTLDYMPPEQLRGKAFFASDLYSLGGTLIFLLTHRSPIDLPLKRMKIDFKDRLSLSAEFADWLEIMLEPAVEDRFKSAREALQELNGEKIVNHSLIKTNRQPLGSRIVLKKTRSNIVIDIPPAGLRWDNLGLGFFSIVWNGFMLMWIFGAIFGGAPLIFLLFSLPHTGVGLFMLGTFLFALAGKTRLEINRHNFRLKWECLGVSRQIQGQTENISRVEIANTQSKFNKQPVINCVIWEGIHQHKFGYWLTPVEKDWLITELADFLQKIPSR